MTKIFKNYLEFLGREDEKNNGVSQDFAENYPGWEKENEDNEACWNCSRCSGCSRCSNIAYLQDKKDLSPEPGTASNPVKGFPDIPVLENVHQKVLEAVSVPQALNMGDWHTCNTTHCRAGWVVFLAGKAGKELEDRTSTQFAAMQIYKASSPIRVSPVRFFEDNETALADIKRCAEEEASAMPVSQ